MSRSRASTPTDQSRARRRGLGRKRPRSTLEWEFGGGQEAAAPVTRAARPNGQARHAHDAYRPPPASPTDRAPAIQGEIVTNSAPAAAGNGYVRPAPGALRAAPSGLAALFQGENGLRRAMATRMALDEALDRWWTNAALAPLALLRDGLLLLEAGHDLDETQRSFLLRSALRTRRGILTALHHQTDPDRTAFLLKDALLDLHQPLPPQLLPQLRSEDEQSDEWADYLTHDLAYEATAATGQRSILAAVALAALEGQPVPPAPLVGPTTLHFADASRNAGPTPLSHRWSLRWLFWFLLTLLLVIGYGWGQIGAGVAMVAIPGGKYTISDDPATTSADPAQQWRTVTLAPYAIDRTEVTNAAYRLCWESGACAVPTTVASQTRLDYFINPAYDSYPVVNVDWEAAHAYCAWMGKSLPSLEQWEVAAAIAPATRRYFPYPWGARFEARFANGAAAALQDTRAVGSYQPVGDSLAGVADMAGNVAEWTLMPSAKLVNGYVVKGGSFQDDAIDLRTDARQAVNKELAVPWLGFRCARTR